MTRLLRIAWILAGAGLAAGAPSPETAWRWPVAPGPAVSSNFCEYRDGRFHAGLDVRTSGHQGVPCMAVADGWISRVRASSRGYGKALHLTLDTGEQIVYAHLAEFSLALEDTLHAEQMRDTSYAVDFRLPKNRFRAHGGDIIAYSGMTGTTAPHLHLEVRDSSDAPVNPFVHGLPLPDRKAPQVTRVAWIPLEPEARVGGRCMPLEMAPRRVGDGRYVVDDTLSIRGGVGVAVTALDRVDGPSGRLAPYEMQVWSDDSLAARVVLDRFAFDHNGDVDLLYDPTALRGRRVVLYRLYPSNGVAAGTSTFAGDGRLRAQPGRVHAGRVRVTDAAGNRAEVAFLYREGDRVLSSSRARVGARGSLAVDLQGAFFEDAFAVIPLAAGRYLGPTSGDGAAPEMIVRATDVPGIARPLGAYQDRDTATVFVAGLLAGGERRVVFPALGFSLGVPAGALYGDRLAYARGVAAPPYAGDELVRRSRAVRLGPIGLVLRHDATVTIAVESADAHDAVYRFDDGRWNYLASTRDSASVSAPTARPGVFAVFRDDAPPRLGRPRVRRTTSYATGEESMEVQVPVDDEGSGFDESRLRVWLAGTRALARWDFMNKKIVVPLRGEPIIGPQAIRVVALDKIGNSSVLDATVEIDAR